MELFWSVFCGIRTKYGEIRSIFPYSVRMRENADQNNSEYGHFLRSANSVISFKKRRFASQQLNVILFKQRWFASQQLQHHQTRWKFYIEDSDVLMQRSFLFRIQYCNSIPTQDTSNWLSPVNFDNGNDKNPVGFLLSASSLNHPGQIIIGHLKIPSEINLIFLLIF